MSSQLRVDSIVPVNGVPTGGGGGIIQIVQNTNSSSVISNTSTWIDTTLSATITPTSANSKIFVMICQGVGAVSPNTGVSGGGLRILRNSTVIYTPGEDGNGPFGDSYVDATAASATDGTITLRNVRFHRINIQVLDSPSTTSTVTYKTQGKPYITGNSEYFWTNRLLANNDIHPVVSYITLMEVSG